VPEQAGCRLPMEGVSLRPALEGKPLDRKRSGSDPHSTRPHQRMDAVRDLDLQQCAKMGGGTEAGIEQPGTLGHAQSRGASDRRVSQGVAQCDPFRRAHVGRQPGNLCTWRQSVRSGVADQAGIRPGCGETVPCPSESRSAPGRASGRRDCGLPGLQYVELAPNRPRHAAERSHCERRFGHRTRRQSASPLVLCAIGWR